MKRTELALELLKLARTIKEAKKRKGSPLSDEEEERASKEIALIEKAVGKIVDTALASLKKVPHYEGKFVEDVPVIDINEGASIEKLEGALFNLFYAVTTGYKKLGKG